MLRILAIVALAGVVAFYTKPTQAEMEAKAKVVAETPAGATEGEKGGVLDQIVGAVKGFAAGDGKYEDFYLVGHYTADLPGSDFVECWGAFKYTQCEIKSQ